MKTVIFHHNDPDGWCSAAIMFNAIGGEKILREINYGKKIPWELVEYGDKIYMLDFSLPMPDMFSLQAMVGKENFVWIDHHVSAIKDSIAQNFESLGLREVGKAACELCWEYAYPARSSAIPENVRMLGRYDVWDKSAWPDALYAMYALKSLSWFNIPSAPEWMGIILDKTSLAFIGAPIARYQDGVNIEICKRAAFETELCPDVWLQAGYHAIACNSPMCNSMLFDSIWDPDKHDIMLSFFVGSNGIYTVSVYSTKPEIDCSLIAKAFGGGGHKSAAGFQCVNLPFKINK